MRGEHKSTSVYLSHSSGSSPHARGTLRPRPARREIVRFIPACAGNTCRHGGIRRHCPVHPRMRGEHEGPLDEMGPVKRFIPACAGNTGGRVSLLVVISVHPRMRGEHPRDPSTTPDSPGSSPHARGTHRPAGASHSRARFIPACAGNTAPRQGSDQDPPVHPRMRGEHDLLNYWHLARDGSSPHARGTRRVHPLGNRGPRFIPACAGNTAET